MKSTFLFSPLFLAAAAASATYLPKTHNYTPTHTNNNPLLPRADMMAYTPTDGESTQEQPPRVEGARVAVDAYGNEKMAFVSGKASEEFSHSSNEDVIHGHPPSSSQNAAPGSNARAGATCGLGIAVAVLAVAF